MEVFFNTFVPYGKIFGQFLPVLLPFTAQYIFNVFSRQKREPVSHIQECIPVGGGRFILRKQRAGIKECEQ